MRDVVLLVVLFIAAYAGFLALALSQKQHWLRILPDAAGEASPPSGQFRVAGGIFLALSFALALMRDGAAFGSILCGVSLTIAGGAAVVTLTANPFWLRSLALAFAQRRGGD